MRNQSALSIGFRPVRELFKEMTDSAGTHWYCKLCPYVYSEYTVGEGWPLSMSGLFMLVKHLRGHTST